MADDSRHISPPPGDPNPEVPEQGSNSATSDEGPTTPIETTDTNNIATDDTQRKRKSPSPDSEHSDVDASPQKRPKVLDSLDIDMEAALSAHLMEEAEEMEGTIDTPVEVTNTSMQDSSSISSSSATTTSTIPPPQPIPSILPSQSSYQAPMPPPMIPSSPTLSPQQQPPPRENMQFTPSDLPKDDDGMMRWLAQRVRDSAAQNRDMMKTESENGMESDPETRAERERVRAENRERKKKWREENSDRNKDNDLRGRVSRRANKLFGSNNSEEKKAWMEKEFSKRKVKREFKSRLKVHDRQGSYTWNVNDDHTDDTPSQMMRDMLSRQEGAAENFRNWISTADIDNDTWNAALADISTNPEMMREVEALILADDAGANAAGVGQGDGLGKGTDDSLASKFDAAYDAIVREFTPRKPQPSTQIQQVADSLVLDIGDIDISGVTTTEIPEVEQMGEVAALQPDAETQPEVPSMDNLTEDDLQRMLESGEMTMDEIEALEAALQGADAEAEAEQALEDQADIELPQVEEMPATKEPTDTQDAEIPLPELHTDATDISELQEHFESLDPEMQKEFLETFMKESNEQAEEQAEEQVEETNEAVLADAEMQPVEEVSAAVEQQLEKQVSEEDITAALAEEAVDSAGEEGNLLEFLQAAGINPDDLNEEQLQKFINAVSGEGDIESVISEILMAQQPTQSDPQDQAQTETQQQPQEGHVENTTQQFPSLTPEEAMALDQMDEDDDMMYGDGEGEGDYDEDDLDLTPDIMRLILQNSNYSSILKQQTLEGYSGEGVGDAHTVMPKPSVSVSTQRDTARRQGYPIPQPPQFSYSTGYGYGYGYQRRDHVEVLPPGYSAYHRPPPSQEQPRYPDLSHLIKPLAYMPRKATPAKDKTPDDKPADTESANKLNGNDVQKKSNTAGWAEIFKFQIPIPTFLGSANGANRTAANDQKSEEKEKNVKALGFPPMIAGLGL